MRFLREHREDFFGKKVLLRADLNVPIDSGIVQEPSLSLNHL